MSKLVVIGYLMKYCIILCILIGFWGFKFWGYWFIFSGWVEFVLLLLVLLVVLLLMGVICILLNDLGSGLVSNWLVDFKFCIIMVFDFCFIICMGCSMRVLFCMRYIFFWLINSLWGMCMVFVIWCEVIVFCMYIFLWRFLLFILINICIVCELGLIWLLMCLILFC